jgi:histone H3
MSTDGPVQDATAAQDEAVVAPSTSKRKSRKPTKRTPKLNAKGTVRRPHRFRSGTVALREIKRYQKSTDLLIKKRPFQRLVREIIASIPTKEGDGSTRVTKAALEALQEAAEYMIVDVMDLTNMQALSNGRTTIMKRDMKFVGELIKRIRG